MEQDERPLVDRLPDGPLTPRELQETRYSNHMIADELVSARQIKEWGQKVDRLWWCLGWLVLTVTNWKALAIAGAAALIIGGSDMLALIASKLQGGLE